MIFDGMISFNYKFRLEIYARYVLMVELKRINVWSLKLEQEMSRCLHHKYKRIELNMRYCVHDEKSFIFPAPDKTWNIKAVAISVEARRPLPFLQLFLVVDLIYENIWCIVLHYIAGEFKESKHVVDKNKFQHFITWGLMTQITSHKMGIENEE